MTPGAQRIAIAQALGWSHCEVISSRTGFKSLGGYPPNARSTDWVKLPDYLADLNAMHEAEKTLNEVQMMNYADRLYWDENHKGLIRRALTAPATLRAEAFLRTLGKWDNSE